MLTVQGLVEEMQLELLVGGEAAEAPIRWVHPTELDDPTPWLSGGELILTTGMQLGTGELQREFVERLSSRHAAGIGFGTGFDHKKVPEALCDAARDAGLPLFEVPYALPFIAITEKAFAALVNRQYEVLQRTIAIHRRMERLLLDEAGLDELARAISATIGGAVAVLDPRGRELARREFQRPLPDGAIEAVHAQAQRRARAGGQRDAFVPDQSEIAGRALALPVLAGARGGPQAWLLAVRDAGGFGDVERLTLEQSVTVIALELMRQRAMRDTERRLAGDVLAEALAGQLDAGEVAARLRPFGVGAEAAVLVFNLSDPRAAEGDLDRALAASGHRALVASRQGLLCAVVDGAGIEPVELAGQARAALAERHGEVAAAASRVADAAELRRSFHEARCALEAAALAPRNGRGHDHVASYRDLGSFQLLLSLQDDDALRLYCDSVLSPLENGGNGDYGDELVRSLEVFIEQNGQWERAARELYCHRHTLRYRIRRIEELTGRDLSSARDRIEFWLALRGRELVS
jgi:PucR family transcriptional regulator, purine catabolism regulatory protein